MTQIQHVHQDTPLATIVGAECPVMGECVAQIPGCSGQGQCQPNPFDMDVHNEVNYEILCDHCAKEIGDEI